MTALAGKRFVLGITGGVAAYKAAELTRLLVKSAVAVDVVLTAAAERFVGAPTFQALSGRTVWRDLWDESAPGGMAHIELSRGAEAILIAPATADFIAKLAHGFADDLLSTLCLARECPLLVAPAMNRQMWQQAATQRNVRQLQDDGVLMLGPASGEQACGEVGMGRMLEAEELFDELVGFLQPKLLAGRKVLLTAGPTMEAIDPVRYISNASSGKMGYALARACVDAGASVTLVSGPVSLPTPRGVRRIDVRSAQEMHSAVFSIIPEQEIFISVAAVADYRPLDPANQKIKKDHESLQLNLARNPDILAEVAALPKPPFCVGFAAESQELARYADGKRVAKKLPLVVGNLVQDGLGGDDNRIILFDATGSHPLPSAPKLELARSIVAHIASLIGRQHASH